MPVFKALSVRQPYAWLLVNGIKTCENRSWKMISGSKPIIQPVPMKGRLQLFDVDLPYEITWADEEFYEFAHSG